MSTPVFEPVVHTRTCPFVLHGGVCECGVIDASVYELVADNVWAEPDLEPESFETSETSGEADA